MPNANPIANPNAPSRVSSLLVLVLSLTLGLGGCGYSWIAGKGLGELRSVSIRTPRNDSFQPGVELVVADALRREFLRRGANGLTENVEAADLVVGGAVRPVRTVQRGFSSVVLALEYEVTLELDLHATRRDGSELPIGDGALRESERYLSSADVEAQRKNRDEALRRLSILLAGRFWDAVTEVATP